MINHGRLVSEGTPAQLKEHIGGSVVELSIPDSQRPRALDILNELHGSRATYDGRRGFLQLTALAGPERATS